MMGELLILLSPQNSLRPRPDLTFSSNRCWERRRSPSDFVTEKIDQTGIRSQNSRTYPGIRGSGTDLKSDRTRNDKCEERNNSARYGSSGSFAQMPAGRMEASTPLAVKYGIELRGMAIAWR
jgi:hypothetical protein